MVPIELAQRQPKTLEEMIKRAGRVEVAVMRMKSTEKKERDLMVMDVDMIQTGSRSSRSSGGLGGLGEGKKTWEDYQKWMIGKCWGCRTKGHLKSECK